jgi:hypothetical protein
MVHAFDRAATVIGGVDVAGRNLRNACEAGKKGIVESFKIGTLKQ